jgi:hypothetical protein
MMRRLVVLLTAGALVCALAATVAYALTNNQISYKVTLTKKGKPSKAKPATLAYRGVLDVSTTDGKQPNVGSPTKIYFAKQIVQHAKYFPSCNPTALDGQPTVPASCKKAVVGSGNASASAGTPGTAINPGLGEQLTVTAYNGLHGKQLLLALNGSSPLAITNRVIIGQFGPASGKYGYTLTFTVPADLQFQQGLQVALTHFDVKIAAKTVKAKIKGTTQKVSYVGLTACPKNHKLPVQVVENFAQDGTAGSPPPAGGQVFTLKSTMKC